jgi:hypothetical protein
MHRIAAEHEVVGFDGKGAAERGFCLPAPPLQYPHPAHVKCALKIFASRCSAAFRDAPRESDTNVTQARFRGVPAALPRPKSLSELVELTGIEPVTS